MVVSDGHLASAALPCLRNARSRASETTRTSRGRRWRRGTPRAPEVAENREWSHSNPDARLQERFDEVAAARGADHARMPQAILTRARLKSRGTELAAIIASAGSALRIRSELLLTDQDHHLFGILDITAPGAGGLIIDLKTGCGASAESSPAIEHQMTFYAICSRPPTACSRST